MASMGKIYSASNWLIKVQGNEHPPVHVHVLHPDGRASISINGTILNRGVPTNVIRQALEWVLTNTEVILTEWARMNNPPDRSTL